MSDKVEEKKKSIQDEINDRLKNLSKASLEFNTLISGIDIRYQDKEMEVKQRESAIEKLKKEQIEIQEKSNRILQDATEKSAEMKNTAEKNMHEAARLREEATEKKEQVDKMMVTAQALADKADEKQRTADQQWAIVEEKKRRLAEAMR